MKELMDIVDEKDKIIGQSDKETIHRDDLLHRSVHIFIADSHGRLFCRQRSFKKHVYPGYWSTSVGAHVMSGKTYDETAREELKNILGLDCKLKMIGKSRVHDSFENEISATYAGQSDEKMRFNKAQIEGGKFMELSEILQLKNQKNATPHLFHSLELYLNSKSR